MKLDDVIEFARENGNGRIYKDWTDDEVRQHLPLHQRNGTLMVVEDQGEISGFVAYRRIKDFDGNIVPHFWAPSDPEGKDVYLHELCNPGKHATYTMLATFEESNKDAKELTYWGHRKNKLKRYTYQDFKRIICLHLNHQTHLT